MIKLQENKFKFLEKNFKEIIIKDFHWEANGHNDNYMINMGGQSPKISDNCPLFGPYLQRCFSTDLSTPVIMSVFYLIFFPAGFSDIHPGHNKMAWD